MKNKSAQSLINLSNIVFVIGIFIGLFAVIALINSNEGTDGGLVVVLLIALTLSTLVSSKCIAGLASIVEDLTRIRLKLEDENNK